MESELAKNVQLKKVLLSSAEEEVRKATRENDDLNSLSFFSISFPLLDRGSVEILTNLDIQDRHVPALCMTLVD